MLHPAGVAVQLMEAPFSPWEVNTTPMPHYPSVSRNLHVAVPSPSLQLSVFPTCRYGPWVPLLHLRTALLCGILVAPANWYPGDQSNPSQRGHPNGPQPKHQEAFTSHSLKVEGFGLKSKATQLPLPHTAQMKMVENANARECVCGVTTETTGSPGIV